MVLCQMVPVLNNLVFKNWIVASSDARFSHNMDGWQNASGSVFIKARIQAKVGWTWNLKTDFAQTQ